MNVARFLKACKTRQGITFTPPLLVPDSTAMTPNTACDLRKLSLFCWCFGCVSKNVQGTAARVAEPLQKAQAQIVR